MQCAIESRRYFAHPNFQACFGLFNLGAMMRVYKILCLILLVVCGLCCLPLRALAQSCNPSVNLARSATASSSGGGVTTYGPARMNDGVYQGGCTSSNQYHWVSTGTNTGGSLGTAWIQYTWSSNVVVSRINIDTSPYNQSACAANTGRNLAGGDVQYWTGSSWVTVSGGVVRNQTNDWSLTFPSVTTTRLRIYAAHATHLTGQRKCQ
jgi:hypothetical protein